MTDQTERVSRSKPAASFVVYDRRTGEIVLTHHASAAPGAVVPSDDQMARFILEHAVLTTGRDATGIECLKIGVDDLKPRVTYRVDVGDGRLIEASRDEAKRNEPPAGQLPG